MTEDNYKDEDEFEDSDEFDTDEFDEPEDQEEPVADVVQEERVEIKLEDFDARLEVEFADFEYERLARALYRSCDREEKPRVTSIGLIANFVRDKEPDEERLRRATGAINFAPVTFRSEESHTSIHSLMGEVKKKGHGNASERDALGVYDRVIQERPFTKCNEEAACLLYAWMRCGHESIYDEVLSLGRASSK